MGTALPNNSIGMLIFRAPNFPSFTGRYVNYQLSPFLKSYAIETLHQYRFMVHAFTELIRYYHWAVQSTDISLFNFVSLTESSRANNEINCNITTTSAAFNMLKFREDGFV